jgi:pimeloyl-ACP methyl ester carboxylesterase
MAAGGVLMLDLIRPLSAYGPVVAPELPGSIFGQTDTPHPRAGRIETNARFVRTFTSTLGLDRVVLHGWSMGAAAALRFAADEPDRVVAAVLACPPLPAPLTRAERLGWQTLGRPALAVGPVLARGLVRLVGRRTIEAKLAYLDGKSVPSMFSGLGGDISKIPPETVAVWREQIAEVRHHPATLGHAATAFASVVSAIYVDQAATWSAIDRVTAPVLLLWGSEDPLITRLMIDGALARRPDWHLHVLAGAGHNAPAERPDEYVETVGRWLTDHVRIA